MGKRKRGNKRDVEGEEIFDKFSVIKSKKKWKMERKGMGMEKERTRPIFHVILN